MSVIIQGPVSGLSDADQAYIDLAQTTVPDASKLVDLDNLGTAAYAATSDFDAAGAAATAQAASEPVLGNPASDGYVLSSTVGGVRSWVAQSGGGSTYYTILVDAAGGGDYATLSAALAAASAGDAIFVRNGTYAGGVTISIDNIRIVGESRDGVVIQSPLANTPCFTVTANNVTLELLTIDGRRDEQTGTGTHENFVGIFVSGDGCKLKRLRIFDTLGNGITGTGADNGTVDGCSIENIATSPTVATLSPVLGGVQLINTNNYWTLRQNYFTGWSQAIGFWYATSKCVADGNFLINNNGYWNGLVGGTRSAFEDYGATAPNIGNRFINNTVIGSTSCCMEIAQGTVQGVYSNNYCAQWNIHGDNTGVGFQVTDGGASERTYQHTIHGNIINGSTGETGACYLSGANHTVTSNRFHSIATAYPLVCDGAISTNLVISGNQFNACSGGIFMTNTSGSSTITGNSFNNPVTTTDPAIRIDTGSGYTITDNVLTGAARFIQIASASTKNYIGGNISTNGRFLIDGSDNIVEGNATTAGTSGIVTVAGDRNTIKHNIFSSNTSLTYIVDFSATSADNICTGNYIDGTGPTRDLGTGNKLYNNHLNGVVSDYQPMPIDASLLSKSSDYQLAAGDAAKIIECDGTFTVTLPNGLHTGFQATIVNVGSGTITLAAATTLQSAGTQLATQYTAATVYHRGSNVWIAFGRLT